MSHLSIYINDIPVNTRPDASIDIEDKNPLFNDVEMFSYPIEVPFDGNRQVTQSLDTPQSGIRPVDLEHSPMRVMVDGLPFRSGTAVVSDGEEMQGAASVSMEAAEQSFADLIADLECKDIPLADKIKIGEKLGEVSVKATVQTHVKVDVKNHKDPHRYIWDTVEGSFTPQALGYSLPAAFTAFAPKAKSTKVYRDGQTVAVPADITETYINVSRPYVYGTRQNPYCNARVCYKHHALSEDGTTADGTIKSEDCMWNNEDIYPFWVLDADRPQSGLCFYVLYFLECLFRHLGVQYDLSRIAYGDFLRLCFYTTKCRYTEERMAVAYTEGGVSHERFVSLNQINQWLTAHGMGGQLAMTAPENKNVDQITVGNDTWRTGSDDDNGEGGHTIRSIELMYSIEGVESVTAYKNAMYATSENFPEMTVQSLIDSLENQFGIRFCYDYQRNKVTAYLMRDVFRSQETPIEFAGSIDGIVPISEKITGVRAGYSDESDSKEQRDNVKNGVKDYDTAYDYIDYRDGMVVTGTDLYRSIFRNPDRTDMCVYIDLTTGNKYRVKIDSDYTDSATMNPRLFEVGQWKGVEEGDCSEKNSDFVKELLSDLQPLPLTDVNYRRTLDAVNKAVQTRYSDSEDGTRTSGSVSAAKAMQQPILVAFCDEDMEHEFVEQRINNLITSGTSFGEMYAVEVLSLVESYDPSGTDDGNSPLQTYDWGNAIAIMRGAGSDSQVQLYDYGYDGFDNSKWQQTIGAYALSTDTMDQFGNVYDYNGTLAGLDVAGSFSLKPRAYVSPDVMAKDYATGRQYKVSGPLVANDYQSQAVGDVVRVKTRGYVDQFLAELIYFYLHRKYFKITVKTTAAALADIPNHWRSRWNVGGVVGYIDKVSYSVKQSTGIDYADIYLYAI